MAWHGSYWKHVVYQKRGRGCDAWTRKFENGMNIFHLPTNLIYLFFFASEVASDVASDALYRQRCRQRRPVSPAMSPASSAAIGAKIDSRKYHAFLMRNQKPNRDHPTILRDVISSNHLECRICLSIYR